MKKTKKNEKTVIQTNEAYTESEHRNLFKDKAMEQVVSIAIAQILRLKEVLNDLEDGKIDFSVAFSKTQTIKDEFLKIVDGENITNLIPMEDVARIWKNKVEELRNGR